MALTRRSIDTECSVFIVQMLYVVAIAALMYGDSNFRSWHASARINPFFPIVFFQFLNPVLTKEGCIIDWQLNLSYNKVAECRIISARILQAGKFFLTVLH